MKVIFIDKENNFASTFRWYMVKATNAYSVHNTTHVGMALFAPSIEYYTIGGIIVPQNQEKLT